MKKLAFIALAAFALFSCNKEEVIVENEAQPQQLKYVFNVADKPSFDADTRAVKTSWEKGDKIYVVYDDVTPESLADLTILTYDGSDWDVAEGNNKPKETGGTLDAIYYGNPNPQKLAFDSERNAFFFDTVTETGKYMYLVKNNIPYSKKGDTVEASISLDFDNYSNETYVQFCITGLEGNWLSDVKDHQHTNNLFGWNTPIWQGSRFCYIDLSSAYHAGDFRLDNRGEEGHYLYCSIEQGADAITITLIKADGDHKGRYFKTFNKKITGKCAAITFKGPQFDDSGSITNGWNRITGFISGHPYVELGSGVRWASTNVGADSPDVYGNYFAWGETEPKDNYSESNYSVTTFQDAATVNWGDNWRTPSKDDWDWLINHCTWQYTDNYSGTGKFGMIVTSNESGYTGNSIFLPGAGYYHNTTYKQEYLGFYWSSSLYSDYDAGAYSVNFDLKSPSLEPDFRYQGLSVRAVAD